LLLSVLCASLLNGGGIALAQHAEVRQTARTDKGVFSDAPYRASGAHYIDFLAETGGAITPGFIRRPDVSEHLPLSNRNLETLYRILRKRHHSAQLNPNRTRLVIEASKGYEQAIVDQTGVVQMGKDEYQLSPLDFVALSRVMEEIADEVAARRHKPRR
jgi:hypothetical protein